VEGEDSAELRADARQFGEWVAEKIGNRIWPRRETSVGRNARVEDDCGLDDEYAVCGGERFDGQACSADGFPEWSDMELRRINKGREL
jgi:hypothetical protein